MSKICYCFHHNGFKAKYLLVIPFVNRPVTMGSIIKASKVEVLIGLRIFKEKRKFSRTCNKYLSLKLIKNLMHEQGFPNT